MGEVRGVAESPKLDFKRFENMVASLIIYVY